MDKHELLECIAGYLPYRLKCKYKKCNFLEEVVYVRTLDKPLVGTFCGKGAILDYKFYLRPLSDLTKPCLEGGKVPIEELGKIAGYTNLERTEVDGNIEYVWNTQLLDDCQGYSFGWSQELKALGVWLDSIEGDPISIECNVDVIQFMYKHHFDINGLIEKGYAIDINTLKQ